MPLVDQARAIESVINREDFTADTDLLFCTEVGGYVDEAGVSRRLRLWD